LKSYDVTTGLLAHFPASKRDIYLLSHYTLQCFDHQNVQSDKNVFGSETWRLEIAKQFLHLHQFVGYNLEGLISQEDPLIQDIIDSGVVPDLVNG
jgi:hypothetical protein